MPRNAIAASAAAINDAHQRAKACAEEAVDYAIECGRLLLAKKADVKHGGFESWVENNTNVPLSTARLYMRASRQVGHGQAVEALRALYPSGREPQAKAKATEPKTLTVSVLDAPTQQLDDTPRAVATPVAKPVPDADDEWTPDEIAKAEAIDREYSDSIDKVMESDDKLAAAHAEIKRQAAEIAILKLARDGYMNGKTEMTRLLDAAQRKVDRLEKKLKAADNELEALRERVAIMESAA